MRSVLNENVLVLNRNWQVAGFYTVEDAIVSVFRDRASILDTVDYLLLDWDAWVDYNPPNDYQWIKTPTGQVPVPQIVALKHYGEKPPKKLTFSKPVIYHRDNHRCLYCGVQLPAVKLTLDHVVPRSKGGPTSFENCATACEPCNRKKANLSLEESGMKLRHEPYVPDWTPKMRIPNQGKLKDSWLPFLRRDGLLDN